jgi:hypothetical protein
MYFDKEGNQITFNEWSKLFSDKGYQIIKKTTVGIHEVSTIYLGMTWEFSDGKPLIFETMVFPECEICERDATETEAVATHARIVSEISGG